MKSLLPLLELFVADASDFEPTTPSQERKEPSNDFNHSVLKRPVESKPEGRSENRSLSNIA